MTTYLQLFRTGDSHLRGREDLAWLSRLKPEQDNLRAALQWALDEARYTDAAWLMVAVSYFWVLCGNGYEESRWLAQLLPYRQTLAVDLRLANLLTFYRAAVALEEFQPIDPYMDEIMQLLEDCPYQLLHASAWSFRAWIAADVAQVAAHLEQGIELARASGEPPELGAEFGAFSDRDFILAAIGFGADIEEQVAPFGARLDEGVDELCPRFVDLVGGFIGPLCTQCETGFPGARQRTVGNLLFGRCHISTCDQYIGL